MYRACISAHVRTGSAGSPMDINNLSQPEEDLRCLKKGTHRAHQQAITVLDSEGGRVLTGSQDHTLKVFRYKTVIGCSIVIMQTILPLVYLYFDLD